MKIEIGTILQNIKNGEEWKVLATDGELVVLGTQYGKRKERLLKEIKNEFVIKG